MSKTLYAGAARRIINPRLGHSKAGIRLFGEPIQAIESDLTATALVLLCQGSDSSSKLVILATDLCTMRTPTANELRRAVARALDIPMAHVMLNLSHNHSSPAMPDFVADSPENMALKEKYQRDLSRWLVEAAVEADHKLQPARLGTGWGESDIGVYRREYRDGRDVLGEDPDHSIDSTVGVIRVDDLDGNAIATLFRYSAHPVTVGPRSQVASTDFPGPARDVIESTLGGLALFMQGCGGNMNPRVGIGYEIDCRDTKKRVGMALGGEALKVAANIRTNTKAGARRPIGTVPNILFTPWEAVEGDTCTFLGAVEETVSLGFIELPSFEQAAALHTQWSNTLAERSTNGAPEWQLRVAVMLERWSQTLLNAVRDGNPTFPLNIQVMRINDIVLAALNVEAFFETGLTIRSRSPLPDTFVFGFTNGAGVYLPRAEDYPPGGWKLDGSYAVPDMLFQYCNLPTAFHPDSEQRVIDETVALIKQLADPK